jgi:NAD(P)-dependent dehydrogenase (short-subunit alcohol dehydrogenase family)
MDATALLRPSLLAGRVVVLGGGGEALGPPLAALGAVTPALTPALDENATAAQVAELLSAHATIDVLLHDLRPAFARGRDDGEDPLRTALDDAWIAVRAVATGAFIPYERGGRVVLIAPPPGDGDPAAVGLRAAAENLARTLSIEWARHGVRTVAITPGPATDDAQLAALAGYLASPAGDYFSGCRLALGEVG